MPPETGFEEVCAANKKGGGMEIFMREMKFAGRYIRRYIPQYLIGIIALLLVDLLNVYIPRFTGQITDGLETHTITMPEIWMLIGKILLFGVLIAVGRFCWRYFILGPARSIERELRDDMFGHLETLSMRYYNENKTGDLMAHFTNDLQSIRMFLGFTIITAFDATVMLVLVLAQMILYVDLKLTVVAEISGETAGIFGSDRSGAGGGLRNPGDQGVRAGEEGTGGVCAHEPV